MIRAPVYDVNKKVAGAFRLRVTGIQKFMTSLDVPPVSAKKIEKREIGVTIRKLLKDLF